MVEGVPEPADAGLTLIVPMANVANATPTNVLVPRFLM
jgi:hypothetical protein